MGQTEVALDLAPPAHPFGPVEARSQLEALLEVAEGSLRKVLVEVLSPWDGHCGQYLCLEADLLALLVTFVMDVALAP